VNSEEKNMEGNNLLIMTLDFLISKPEKGVSVQVRALSAFIRVMYIFEL
jgi:hypothetical protein